MYRINGKEVCKKYFLHTIGFKDDSFVRRALLIGNKDERSIRTVWNYP